MPYNLLIRLKHRELFKFPKYKQGWKNKRKIMEIPAKNKNQKFDYFYKFIPE